MSILVLLKNLLNIFSFKEFKAQICKLGMSKGEDGEKLIKEFLKKHKEEIKIKKLTLS